MGGGCRRAKVERGFAGRRVFITGHTGFKGSWLALWLKRLGAEVAGYARPAATDPSLYAAAGIAALLDAQTEGDIRDRDLLSRAIAAFVPDVIFHLAAQPLVRAGYRDPAETFDVNVMGTVALLETVRSLARPCAVVVVTSDKCYENREQVWGYREIDRLGGRDPYSASKGAAELVVASYRQSFFPPEHLSEHGVQLASARAGNVIGGGDWAADRIVADLARCLAAGEPVPIRCPGAVRPWQHVLEPLSGYLTLAARMLAGPAPLWCEGWNFGPHAGDALTVSELAEKFVSAWGRGNWIDQSDPGQPHEARVLRLNIDKALAELDWEPRWTVEQAIERTARWYQQFYEAPSSAKAACEDDLDAYSTTGADPGLNRRGSAAA